MSQGAARPWGHQGSVDGDDTGGSGPPSTDTLAGLYTFGLGDNPTVDNLLVGSYFQTYFDTDGSIFVKAIAAATGQPDQHPALRLERDVLFSGGGEQSWLTEQHITRMSGGPFSPQLGARILYTNINDGGNVQDYEFDEHVRYFPALGPPWVPGSASTGQVTFAKYNLINRTGSFTPHYFNSDGVYQRELIFPDNVARTMIADAKALFADGGGTFPANGSRVRYLIEGGAQVPDPGTDLVAFDAVQDDAAYGAGQAAGHWDFLASTMAAGMHSAFLITPGLVVVRDFNATQVAGFELEDGRSTPLSTAGSAVFRYNGAGTAAEISTNGGNYFPILTSASSLFNVSTSAAMTAIPVTGVPDGTLCYVASRDALFRLKTSALAVNTYDTLASADAARRWIREGHVSKTNAAVTTWTLNTTTGDDDAAGTGGNPLKTLSELSWRLWQAQLPANVLAQCTGSQQAGDLPVFTFRSQGSITFTLEAQLPAPIFASTLTAVPGVVTAGPSATENTITDAAVPGGSFTAAGALANGVMGNRTAGGDAFFFFAKDNGATVARISVPTAALANGNAYAAYTLPTLGQVRFEETRFNSCVLRQWQATSQTFTDPGLRFERCFLTTCTVPNVVFANCAIQGSTSMSVVAPGRNGNFSTGGMIRGTGTNVLIISGGACTISGKLTLQGAGITCQGTGFMLMNAVDIIINDWTGALGALTSEFGGHWAWTTGGAIVGLGNGAAAPMVAVTQFGNFAHVANPLLVAGSTANANPFLVSGTGALTIAQENAATGAPNAQGNGIFPTT